MRSGGPGISALTRELRWELPPLAAAWPVAAQWTVRGQFHVSLVGQTHSGLGIVGFTRKIKRGQERLARGEWKEACLRGGGSGPQSWSEHRTHVCVLWSKHGPGL